MITNISTLPTVPNRNDPTTFSERADALLGAMPTLVTELNNFVTEVNTLSFKTACRAATTTNITLSGTQTIDGISISSGDRVLVKNQNNQADNGIYIASANAWTRAADMDTPAEIAGSFVPITFGSTQGGKIYYTTFNATGSTIGVTAIPWNSLTEGSVTGVGTLAVVNGGTGISSYSVGDLLYASAATTLEKLSAAASGNVLKSGTVPSWGKVALASDVSGTLSASNGGTGLTGPGNIGNVLTSTGSGWTSSPVSVASTSTSSAGVIQLATDAEVVTGNNTIKAVTPSSLRAGYLVRGTTQVANGTTSTIGEVTNIPTWVKRITVTMYNVSTTSTGSILLRVGTNAGYITSGYDTHAAGINGGTGQYGGTGGSALAGWLIMPSGVAATNAISGHAIITYTESGIWVVSGTVLYTTNTGAMQIFAGHINLGASILTRATLFTSTGFFDTGSVNIMYE